MKMLMTKDRHLTRLFLILTAVTVMLTLLKPTVFFSAANFRSMAVQFPELGFLSIASALVLMSGGIDLSITGPAALSGIVAALIMQGWTSGAGEASAVVVVMACAAALCVGLVCGMVNAVLVAKVGIAPMLVTLGTMNLFTGIGIVLTKGSALSRFPSSFLAIGNGLIWGIPVPFLLFVAAILTLAFFLNRTRLGFKLRVYGSNPKAAFFSAVNNTRVVLSTYVLSGLVSAAAGLIMVSRINTAKADFGSSYGLQALLVAVLGGIDPSGGSGKAIGLFLSIVTLQLLSSGFNLLHVSSFLKDFTWGALLVFVMVLNTVGPEWKRKLTAKAKERNA